MSQQSSRAMHFASVISDKSRQYTDGTHTPPPVAARNQPGYTIATPEGKISGQIRWSTTAHKTLFKDLKATRVRGPNEAAEPLQFSSDIPNSQSPLKTPSTYAAATKQGKSASRKPKPSTLGSRLDPDDSDSSFGSLDSVVSYSAQIACENTEIEVYAVIFHGIRPGCCFKLGDLLARTANYPGTFYRLYKTLDSAMSAWEGYEIAARSGMEPDIPPPPSPALGGNTRAFVPSEYGSICAKPIDSISISSESTISIPTTFPPSSEARSFKAPSSKASLSKVSSSKAPSSKVYSSKAPSSKAPPFTAPSPSAHSSKQSSKEPTTSKARSSKPHSSKTRVPVTTRKPFTNPAPPQLLTPFKGKKYIVVFQGLRVGIFGDWDDAKPYVDRVSGPVFRGYRRWEAANSEWSAAVQDGEVYVLA